MNKLKFKIEHENGKYYSYVSDETGPWHKIAIPFPYMFRVWREGGVQCLSHAKWICENYDQILAWKPETGDTKSVWIFKEGSWE